MPLEYIAGIVVSDFDDLLRWLKKEENKQRKYLIVSLIAPAMGWMEDVLVEQGYNCFSISPHARNVPGIPLIVPEVNGLEVISSLNRTNSEKGVLFKSPNCVSVGLCIVLKALQDNFGLVEASVTTFQSLTGRVMKYVV